MTGRLTRRPTGFLHWWRMLTEPSGAGRLHGFGPCGWTVQYDDGTIRQPCAYDVACDYADMFGGTVIRYNPKEKK